MRRRWLVLGLAIALTPLFAGPAGASAQFGFSDGEVFDITGDDLEAQLMAAAGAGLHRFTLSWRGVEKVPGQYDFGPYDPIYAADLRRGIRPVIVLAFAPEWTWAPGSTCPPGARCAFPPARERLEAWANMVRQVALRYPEMAALEIWNEPNLVAYWEPYPDPAHYAELVRAAHDAVRGLGIPVLAGSLGGAPIAGDADESGVAAGAFLERVYQAGARGRFDGISVHPYPHGINLSYTFETLREVEDARARHDDHAPLWITEINATTGGQVTPGEQAALLTRLLRTLAIRPEVSAVLVHTLVTPVPVNAREGGFGVVYPDGRPKPAYCALAALNTSMPWTCLEPFTLATLADDFQEQRWRAQLAIAAAMDSAAAHARGHGGSLSAFSTGPAAPSSEQPADSSADPGRVGVYRFGQGPMMSTLLCAASTAGTSYCAMHRQGTWSFGHAHGSIGAAAHATIRGLTRTW